MAQTNNALPTLKPKDDKHNIFNDGKERTIRYVEWKDEMKTKARSCAKNHGIKVLMVEEHTCVWCNGHRIASAERS